MELDKALDSKAVVSSIRKNCEGEARARRSINRDSHREMKAQARRRTNRDQGMLDLYITLWLQFTLTFRHRFILHMKSTIIRPFIGGSSNFWKLRV